MYIIIAIFLGWLAGVIVNYLSDVLPHKRRITKPFCLQCQSNQPTVNYLIWPRRCAVCLAKRPFRSWVVEVLFILFSISLSLYPPEIIGYSFGLLLLIYFGVVTVIDIEHRLILHTVSIVGGIIGLLLGTYLHGLMRTLIGGIVGFIAMLLLYYLGAIFVKLMARWRGSQVDEVALGFGDVNLSAVIGLILGWPGIIAGLILAILLGGMASLIYLIIKALRNEYDPNLAIPYGPFLVLSAIILLYFGEYLTF